MNINQIFAIIRQVDREVLLNAVEMEFTDVYIEWKPGHFIGTNITQSRFRIEQTSGFFVAGVMTDYVIPFRRESG